MIGEAATWPGGPQGGRGGGGETCEEDGPAIPRGRGGAESHLEMRKKKNFKKASRHWCSKPGPHLHKFPLRTSYSIRSTLLASNAARGFIFMCIASSAVAPDTVFREMTAIVSTSGRPCPRLSKPHHTADQLPYQLPCDAPRLLLAWSSRAAAAAPAARQLLLGHGMTSC